MDEVVKAMKKPCKMLLNYFKLFLIPLVFVFMLIALIIKGVKKLIEKATA